MGLNAAQLVGVANNLVGRMQWEEVEVLESDITQKVGDQPNIQDDTPKP